MQIQQKKIMEWAKNAVRSCLVCYSPEVSNILIIPVRETEVGHEIGAVGFCEHCLSEVDQHTLTRHVMNRINSTSGERDEFPIFDEEGKVTGIVLPSGDIMPLQ